MMAAKAAVTSERTAEHHENVADLERALAPLVEQEQQLEREHRELWPLRPDAHEYSHDRPIDVEPEQRLFAKDRLEEIPRELRQVRRQLLPLWRRLDAARAAERERRRETFTARKDAAIAKLHALLTKAAEVNAELTRIEDEENAACGTATRFNWMELQPETSMTASRLASWIRHCRDHGMLD